jgi:putative tryptophan/tyrosine transport system substrate-binding protein
MRRRDFTAGILLAGSAVTWKQATLARDGPKIPRVGYLGTNVGPASLPPVEAFREGLRQLGYTEGQNIIIEYRWVRGPGDPFAAANAGELVRLDLDLAVAANSTYVPLFRRASSTIPIVFCMSLDPVAEGIVATLARPGGNSSGLSVAPAAYWGKALELLTEGAPDVRQIGVLWDPLDSQQASAMPALEMAARSLTVALRSVHLRTVDELDTAFAAMIDAGAEAVVALVSSVSFNNRVRLASLALRHHLPNMSGYREFTEAGGFLSYGPDVNAAFRRCALYVHKIIKGAKPSELPVEQASAFVLTLNLKTAKTLGLTVPSSLLARADEVIE